jgi:hypothetical protein
MDDTLARVRTRVGERFPADLQRIRDYLRMPSVSVTGEGVAAVAEATGAWIERAGGTVQLVGTPGHPLVLGELDAMPLTVAPWCAPYFVFDRVLGLPWASGGVGHAAGAHGPDEYATLAGLEEHIVGAAAFLLAYADLSR